MTARKKPTPPPEPDILVSKSAKGAITVAGPNVVVNLSSSYVGIPILTVSPNGWVGSAPFRVNGEYAAELYKCLGALLEEK